MSDTREKKEVFLNGFSKLPSDIVLDIISRLPLKTICACKWVSKTCNSKLRSCGLICFCPVDKDGYFTEDYVIPPKSPTNHIEPIIDSGSRGDMRIMGSGWELQHGNPI
ncbi:hypothetical protein IFM89_027208 [Coptis chinensis]|uniref:F-box domain-containing protein n=1 Tax=Coptis chinensis TaxID=261450 RepID=A0A835J0T4_9MAGN|nr:hypothetical protein IFM89_027208 [Coptis chinensis]